MMKAKTLAITIIVMVLLLNIAYAPGEVIAPAPAGGGEGVDDWEDMSEPDRIEAFNSDPSALSSAQRQEAWGHMDLNQKQEFVNTADESSLQAAWDDIPYEDQRGVLGHPHTDPNTINKLTDTQADQFIMDTDWKGDGTISNTGGPPHVMEAYISERVSQGDGLFQDPELEQSFVDYYTHDTSLTGSEYADEFLDSRTEGNINFEMPPLDWDTANDISYDPDTNQLTVNGKSLDLSSLDSYDGITVEVYETTEATDESITITFTIDGVDSTVGEFHHDFRMIGPDGTTLNVAADENGVVTMAECSEDQDMCIETEGGDITVDNEGGDTIGAEVGEDGTTFHVDGETEAEFTFGDYEIDTTTLVSTAPGDIYTDADGNQYVFTEQALMGVMSLTPELMTPGYIQELVDMGLLAPSPSGEEGTEVAGGGNGSSGTTDWNSGYDVWSSINFGTDGSVSGNAASTVTRGNIELNNKGGDFTFTDSLVTAENAALTFPGSSGDPEDINTIKGNFVATRDVNTGEITSATVKSAGGRAIVQNNNAELDMRSHSTAATFNIDYTSGDIANVQATSIDEDDELEMYFGPEYDDYRENYVRGNNWAVALTSPSWNTSGSPITGAAIADLNPESRIYVSNVTLQSEDALYRYIPANYEVSSSKYGAFEDKEICFLDCNNNMADLNKVNVYVQQDHGLLVSTGVMGNMMIDYAGNSREVFDPNYVVLQKENTDYTSDLAAIAHSSIDDTGETDMLFRLNREAKRDLSVRESLEEHNELYYQNAAPSSFTDLNDKVNFKDHTAGSEGHLEINFFTYINDDYRKLVLNRNSYNNVIEFNLLEDKEVDIPVDTFVLVDGKIHYNVDRDISMSPELYNVSIFFRSPDDVRREYGDMVS